MNTEVFQGPALTVENLAMRYPRSEERVFQDLDLTVGQGEFVVILGPSGCGKSTLLRLVAGFERPEAGTVRIGGQLVSDAANRIFLPPERRGIGFVFQSYALWPHMTVFENVAFPLEHAAVLRAEKQAMVESILETFGLKKLAGRLPTELSGGQKQRVALARALIAKPRLLLMDEPLSSLDQSLRLSVQEELAALRRTWRPSVLYVTHDQQEATRLADKIVVLHDHRILQRGCPEELYYCPVSPFLAGFFGDSNLLEGFVETALEAGYYKIRLLPEGPAVTARGPEGISLGNQVNVVIRPQWFQVERDAAAVPAEAITAEIQDVCFMGAQTVCKARWHDYCLKIYSDNRSRLEPGETVRLQVLDAWLTRKEAGGLYE